MADGNRPRRPSGGTMTPLSGTPRTEPLDVQGRNFREAYDYQRRDVPNPDSALQTQSQAIKVCENLQDPSKPGNTVSLVFGMIQSGKTHALCQALGLAADNRYKLFVVLTSDKNALYDQTAKRLRQAAPMMHVLTKEDLKPQNRAAAVRKIKDAVKPTGRCAVLFCSKNVRVLADLLVVLQQAKVSTVPTVVFDDEADEASLNLKAWNKLRPGSGAGAVENVSAIHGAITAVRKNQKTHAYVSVTATPQALFLQGHGTPFRPQHHVVLEPGTDYQGSEHFLLDKPDDYHREVDEDEVTNYSNSDAVTEPPLAKGMKEAVATFLVASAVALTEDVAAGRERGRYSMLLHTTMKVHEHQKLLQSVRTYLSELEDKPTLVTPELRKAYDDIATTVEAADKKMPPMAAVLQNIHDFGLSAQVLDVNSAAAKRMDFTDPAAYSICNIFIGGNVLARGMTIKGLITTYYGRAANRPHVDTVLQHARWYGYRMTLAPYMRLFMPELVWNRFLQLHYHDRDLRDSARHYLEKGRGLVPLLVPKGMEPTRRNITEPGSLGAYPGGKPIYQFLPDVSAGIENVDEIDAFLRKKFSKPVPTEAGQREATVITLKEALWLLDRMPQSRFQKHGSWNDAAAKAALKTLCEARKDDRIRLVWGANMVRSRGDAQSGMAGHIVEYLLEDDRASHRAQGDDELPSLYAFRIRRDSLKTGPTGLPAGPGWGDDMAWTKHDAAPKKAKPASKDFYVPGIFFPELHEGNGYSVFFRLDGGQEQ